MRRQDKHKNMEKANLVLEQSYLKSKGLINENTQYEDLKPLEDILLKKGYEFLGDNENPMAGRRADYRGDKGEVALFDESEGEYRIYAFGGEVDKDYSNIEDAKNDLNKL